MGNLKKRSFSLVSYSNKPGLLHRITGILLNHRINITEIHSHKSEDESGKFVRLDIGIEGEEIDLNKLQGELEEAGLQFVQ